MRFVVDNQLTPRLCALLAERGHDAVHVTSVALEQANDLVVWQWAIGEERVVVSKDEDFFFLANRQGDRGRLLWIRIGNCRKDALLAAVSRSLEALVSAFNSEQRIVELAE